jgi:beta-N-acetylhexosaminidase
VRLEAPVADVASLAAAATGKCLVVVIRDAQRHEWERLLAEELVAVRPDAVVVDVGYPGWRPVRAAGYVTTFGAGRANLIAAAELLLGVDARAG